MTIRHYSWTSKTSRNFCCYGNILISTLRLIIIHFLLNQAFPASPKSEYYHIYFISHGKVLSTNEFEISLNWILKILLGNADNPFTTNTAYLWKPLVVSFSSWYFNPLQRSQGFSTFAQEGKSRNPHKITGGYKRQWQRLSTCVEQQEQVRRGTCAS